MSKVVFRVDQENLQQAKNYAIETCRETGEFSQRFNTLLMKLYEAVRGIDEAKANGWTGGVETTENNLDRRKKALQEQVEKALKLSLMIQAAIDQGEETDSVLTNEMGQLQFTMQGLADIANNFAAQTTVRSEGLVLGATKSVAMSSAALTGAFALVQPDFFTNLQSILQRFQEKWLQVVHTTADVIQEIHKQTADLTNPDITISLKYGSGSLWMVDAYRKGSRFDKKVWPANYTSDAGCGVAATATAFSGLRMQVLPKNIYEKNGNSVHMDWSGVATANGVQVTQQRQLAEKNMTHEEKVAMIDAALQKYVEHPETGDSYRTVNKKRRPI